MKILRAFAGALSAAILLAPSPAREEDRARVEQTLSLEQSLQRALQNNQRVLSTRDDIRIAENQVREVQAQFYPQAGVNLNASRYGADRDFVLPADFGSTFFPRTGDDTKSFYSGRAWLRQPLYNGGRSINNLRLAQANVERARTQYEEIKNSVIFDATKAFYDLLLLRKQIELAKKTSKRISDLSAQIPVTDYRRRAEAQAIQNRLRRRLAEKNRLEQKAYLSFLETLGIELYTSVGISGELDTTIMPLDLAKLLAWAQESRLELRRTDYQREIDRLAVNLSQAERYPVIALGGAYELNNSEFPLDSNEWSATLNVSLPLFDGFSSRARIRQRKIQADQSRLQRTEIEDKIHLEVRDTYGDLMYWQDEMLLRETERQRSEETIAHLEKGGDPVERARTQEWLLEAEEAYWTAVNGHRVALARLEQAVGRPLKEKE